MAEGQVNIRVGLPYVAGKITSCNFKNSITQGKSDIFFNSTDKAIAEKQFSGTSKLHTERSLSCSFYHTFCRAGQNFVGQVEIKVYLPFLAVGKCLQKLMLSPVSYP